MKESDVAVLVPYSYWKAEKEDLVCIGRWTEVPRPPALIKFTDITDGRIYAFTHKTSDIIAEEQAELLTKVQKNPEKYMKSAYVDEFKKHFAAVVQQKEEQKKEEFVPGEMVFAQHVNSPSAILPVKGTPKKLYPAIVREVVGELISIQWSSKEGDKKRKSKYDPQLIHTSRVLKKNKRT